MASVPQWRLRRNGKRLAVVAALRCCADKEPSARIDDLVQKPVPSLSKA